MLATLATEAEQKKRHFVLCIAPFCVGGGTAREKQHTPPCDVNNSCKMSFLAGDVIHKHCMDKTIKSV